MIFLIWEILKWAAKISDLNTIVKFIETIKDIETYAEDIIKAVEKAIVRFKNFLYDRKIYEKIALIVKNKSLKEEIRRSGVEILLNETLSIIDIQKANIYRLGNELVQEDAMLEAGLRLLSFSSNDLALKKIQEIMAKTKDEEIIELCKEVLTQS
ncbi:MAG: hypothetical protein HQK78_17645 [Desulfobacterales bacterium]|nr:hypothetical protein [Desulfobacterales bacterium]